MEAVVCNRCHRLQQTNEKLRAEIERLKRRLEEKERAGKRQAAPFARDTTKAQPKRPGRKPGKKYGKKSRRQPPDHLDEFHEAPLPECCPDCGGDIGETHIDHQYQVEIPRQPIYRQFTIHIGNCQKCGQRVQGRHVLQTSDALGAAASQIGPDGQAAIVDLNKNGGMSQPKVAKTMKNLFGISLTPGGVAHILHRAAKRCSGVYVQIREQLRTAPWVVLDETGWRVGGGRAWLHGAVGPHETIYVIDPTRRGDVAADILGTDFDEIMIHDGWSPYDQFDVLHQQCVRHVLRRCRDMLQTATGRAAHLPAQVAALLRKALHLRDRHADGDVSDRGLVIARSRLMNDFSSLIEPRQADADNERLAKHLRKHDPDFFTFLFWPGLDATNWRAELAMRFAVMLRKVWGGNRTWHGAKTQAVLLSVWRTCWQRAANALDYLSQLLRSPATPLPLPP